MKKLSLAITLLLVSAIAFVFSARATDITADYGVFGKIFLQRGENKIELDPEKTPELLDPAFITSCAGRKQSAGTPSYCNASGQLVPLTGGAVEAQCGDGILGNTPGEQCEVDGTGALVSGSICGSLNACNPVTCRCLYPFCLSSADCPNATSYECSNNACRLLCGNGTLDAGEACDPGLDTTCSGTLSDGQPRCGSTCTCRCECGNGIVETDCSAPQTAEECDEAGTSGPTFGNAIDFTPSADLYRSNVNAMEYQAGAPFTVEFLIRPTALGTALLVSQGGYSSSVAGWSTGINGSGFLNLSTSTGSAASSQTMTNTALAINTSYAVAITKTGTSNVVFHVAAAGATTYTTATDDGGSLQVLGASTNDFTIGASAGETSGFNGVLDEIRIWDRVLTDNELNSQLWQSVSPTATDLRAYWKLDEDPAATTWVDSTTNAYALTRQTNGTGGAATPTTSPFSTAGSGTTCTGGEICESTTCQCIAGGATAQTYYISPTGNDGAAGGTTTPWKTFARAFDRTRAVHVGPGMILKLKAGTYSDAAGTGLPSISCGTVNPSLSPATACTGAAECGTAANPITIEAETAGTAIIQGNAASDVLRIVGCAYYRLSGLVTRQVSSQTTSGCPSNVLVDLSDNVTITDHLAYGTQRYCNSHAITVFRTTSPTVTRTNVYNYHRDAVLFFSVRNGVMNKIYSNSLGQTAVACTTNADCNALQDATYSQCNSLRCGGPQSRESLALYWTSDSVITNSITDNGGDGPTANGGNEYGTGLGQGGWRNRYLGSLILNSRKGLVAQGRTPGLSDVIVENVASVLTNIDPYGAAWFTGGGVTCTGPGQPWACCNSAGTGRPAEDCSGSQGASLGEYFRRTKNSTWDHLTIFGTGEVSGGAIDLQAGETCDDFGRRSTTETTTNDGCTNNRVYDSAFVSNVGTGLDIATSQDLSCVVSNNTASGNGTNYGGRAASGGSQCTGGFTGNNETAPGATFAVTGSGACITHAQSGATSIYQTGNATCTATDTPFPCCSGSGTGTCHRGADLRCAYSPTTFLQLAGNTNNQWARTGTTTGGCAVGASTPATLGCLGQHISCVPYLVTGLNDGTIACWNVHKRVNLLPDNSGCTFAGANLDCPA